MCRLAVLRIKLLIIILIVLPNCKTRREIISKRFDELLQEVILITYPVKFAVEHLPLLRMSHGQEYDECLHILRECKCLRYSADIQFVYKTTR